MICASTGNTSRVRRRVRDRRGHGLRRARARWQDRHGQAQPGGRARRDPAAGRGQLRRLPDARAQARRELPGRAGELGEPVPDRGAEDGGVRGRRRARRRPRHPLPAGRERRQHHRLLEGLPRVRGRRRTAGGGDAPTPDVGFPGRGRRADRAGAPRRQPRDDRHGHPDRESRLVASGDRRPGRVGRTDRVDRRRSRSCVRTVCCRRPRASSSSPRPPRAWRACSPCTPRAASTPGQRIVCTVTGHGLKDPQWALVGEDGEQVKPVRVAVDAVSAARALGLEA